MPVAAKLQLEESGMLTSLLPTDANRWIDMNAVDSRLRLRTVLRQSRQKLEQGCFKRLTPA